MATVTIKFKCKCMTYHQFLRVPARDPETPVDNWVQGLVAHKVRLHHLVHFPYCRERSMSELYLPVTDNGIGLEGAVQR